MRFIKTDGSALPYSPVHLLLGTLLGGPLAGAYFVQANYRALGQTTKANVAAVIGLILAASMVPLFLFYFSGWARAGLWVMYAYGAQGFSPKNPGPYQPRSRTVPVTAVMLMAFVALCFAEISAFRALDIHPVRGNATHTDPAMPALPVE